MKKSTMIAALFAASTLAASAADVYSSNIVGYTKVDLAAGYNMIGAQFVTVGGEPLDLTTVASLDASMSGFNEDGDFATTMRIWDNATLSYTYYGWSGSSGTDILEDPSFDNKWVTQDIEIPVGEQFDAGAGSWINAEKAGTLTITGEVLTTNVVSATIAGGYNMVANPFPIETSVETFGILDASMAGFNEDGDFATTMRVWDNATLSYTYYGWSGSSGTDILEDPSFDNKWLTQDIEIPVTTIPVGSAVWIYAEKTGTVTFTK